MFRFIFRFFGVDQQTPGHGGSIQDKLDLIIDQGEELMAIAQDILDDLVAVDASLDNIQADINTLLANQSGGIDAAGAQQIKDATAVLRSKAEVIANIVP